MKNYTSLDRKFYYNSICWKQTVSYLVIFKSAWQYSDQLQAGTNKFHDRCVW
jgi:hypothetical protein